MHDGRLSRSPNTGAYYLSRSCRPLTAAQVRHRQFAGARRGLDPDEVRAFLHRVATELANARLEVATVREENARIKRALCAWQSRLAPGPRR